MIRPFLLAVVCFLIYHISSVIFKVKLLLQGISYLLFCNDKSWREPVDPSITFKPVLQSKEGEALVERKTIFFVRHGESTWNETFNKGSHRSLLVFMLGYIPGVLRSLSYEFYLLLSGKIDSWFYDSPLSYLGIKQVHRLSQFLQETSIDTEKSSDDEIKLIKILNNDLDSPESKIVSSSLRRSLSTVAATFSQRLQCSPNESILVLPSLQEISRNPDTLSITPPNKQVTASWIDKDCELYDFQSIFTKQVDMRYHNGNKPIDTNGLRRMAEFCHFAFSSVLPQNYIIVGGHSIWFRSFFRTYLPSNADHISKKKKVVNAGCVAFELMKVMSERGETFMIDERSIRVVYGGFK